MLHNVALYIHYSYSSFISPKTVFIPPFQYNKNNSPKAQTNLRKATEQK